MTDLGDRFIAVQAAVKSAAAEAGRDPSSVSLVAVSKRHPARSVAEAFDAGARDFGESYVQELVQKRAEVEHLLGSRSREIRWHFIGRLQRNKVRHLGCVHRVHTVDSLRLLKTIDARAPGVEGVLVQVRIGAEATKSGLDPSELDAFMASAADASTTVCGLMTIGPVRSCPDYVQADFCALRALRDQLQGRHCLPLPELSMGMSADFSVGIEQGSTMVRIGTAIFGDRPL